jgi:hypothetical protein
MTHIAETQEHSQWRTSQRHRNTANDKQTFNLMGEKIALLGGKMVKYLMKNLLQLSFHTTQYKAAGLPI